MRRCCKQKQYHHVVPPRRGYFQRPLRVSLPRHVGKVIRPARSIASVLGRGLRRRYSGGIPKELNSRSKGAHPVYLDPSYDSGLRRVPLGNHESPQALTPGTLSHR